MRVDEIRESRRCRLRVTPTSSGGSVNAVSVVPSSEWPRQGSTKKCPPLRRHRQRIVARHRRHDRGGCPWSAAACARPASPSACARNMSAHGPAATMVSFARTSKRSPLKRVGDARAFDAAIADQQAFRLRDSSRTTAPCAAASSQAFQRQPLGRIHLRVVIEEGARRSPCPSSAGSRATARLRVQPGMAGQALAGIVQPAAVDRTAHRRA